jgi:hypothetical protein
MSLREPQNNLHPYPAEQTRVIFTRGSDRQIGTQHAEQLGDLIQKGMAPFYHRFFRRVLRPEGLGLFETIGFQALSKIIDPYLVNKLVAQIPRKLGERIEGLAEASGIDKETFLTTLILPDLLPMLQAHLIKIRPSRGVEVAAPPKFGCSSFVAKGAKFLHGRNLDFPGVAYWDRYQVLQVTEPENGLRFIGFTSAGVPIAGISGINEAQISVSLHQHYCLQTDWKGSLPFVISEEILSQADSLPKALEILRSSKVASSWAFVVADGKKQDGFIYEAHPKRAGVRWLESEAGVLTHSNYFQSEACLNQDYATTERMNWDNFWRKKTLEKNVRNSLSCLTPELAVSFMSDHTDGFWEEEKIVNRTVSQVYNIQSFVLDPVEMKLYLAEGNCPVHLRKYSEYSLGDLFNGKTSAVENKYSGYQFKTSNNQMAKQEYILSFVSAFDNDFEKALAGLQKSLKWSFTPEAALVAALVNLRLDGDVSRSLDLVREGEIEIEKKMKQKGKDHFPPEYFELLLYEARIQDLLGLSTEAQATYKRIQSHPSLRDKNIRAIAKKAIPYQKNRVKRLIMPYSTYIPFD